MATAFSTPTWDEALRSFLLHIRATRAVKTVYFYQVQLRVLLRWSEQQEIPLDKFGKRHLDAYLVHRQDDGKSKTTLHHDAKCAKVFLKWCQRNDIIERSLLADYEVRAAPKTYKYMPTNEDMRTLVTAMFTFWEPAKNPNARFVNVSKRLFHRDRNYAIVLMLLDTACRIGEVLSLKLEDYRPSEKQINLRETKGREARSIPLSNSSMEAVAGWLKVRKRVMANVPATEDEGWLFISESGGKIDEHKFLHALRRITQFAGLSDSITLHSLRRFSLNKLAKHNLLMAQAIAGHKDTKTTLIYTRIDPDFVRAEHEEVGVLRGVLGNQPIVKRKRLV